MAAPVKRLGGLRWWRGTTNPVKSRLRDTAFASLRSCSKSSSVQKARRVPMISSCSRTYPSDSLVSWLKRLVEHLHAVDQVYLLCHLQAQLSRVVDALNTVNRPDARTATSDPDFSVYISSKHCNIAAYWSITETIAGTRTNHRVGHCNIAAYWSITATIAGTRTNHRVGHCNIAAYWSITATIAGTRTNHRVGQIGLICSGFVMPWSVFISEISVLHLIDCENIGTPVRLNYARHLTLEQHCFSYSLPFVQLD